MDEHDREENRYDLGVLLVHGIGQQGQGDTLVRFGEPVQRWLHRWLSAASASSTDDRAPVVDALFTPPADDAEAPARAELHINRSTKEAHDPTRWLLAESWWANTVLPPSYSELATWALQILPWTLSTHFATRARRVYQRMRAAAGLGRGVVATSLGLEILGFLLAVMLFPVLVTLIVLVLIVGILPIPRVRAFAATLQRILSGTLGDSFVLIASPIQEAAIVGKVERDLRWLIHQGCRRIAVVAHSQGAAIAHAALKKLQSASAGEESGTNLFSRGRLLFATVGSGLNKLAEIRRIRDTSKPVLVWTAPAGLLMLAAALPEFISSFRTEDGGNFFALFIAIMGLSLFVAGVAEAWKENRPEPAELVLGPEVRWLDFYASADPVPNGRMFDSAADTNRVMEARQVHNLASPLGDHLGYWRNSDEFVAQLTCALAEHGGLQLVHDDSLDRSHLAVAAKRRLWRVRWLVLVRFCFFALTVGLSIRYWNDLPTMTQRALSGLASLVKWIPLIGDLIKPISEISVASQLVGAGALAAFGIAVYYLLYGVWGVWNKAEISALFHRTSIEALGTSFLAFLFLFVGTAEALVLAVAGYGAGVVPGLVAALMAWGAFTILLLFIWGVSRGVLFQFVEMVSTLWRLIARLIERSPKNDPEERAQPDGSKRSQATPGRLIDWREERSGVRIPWISLFVLILLSYPYQAFVAANIPPSELWAPRWSWGLGLLKAISSRNAEHAIADWQWLLGALVVVLGANAVRALGGFRALHHRFIQASHAGPASLAHADLLPTTEATELLRQAATLQEKDYATWESILEDLRREEAGAETGKAEITVSDGESESFVVASGSLREKASARLLRTSAHDLCEIATRLPKDDAQARELLKRAARTSPHAALTLAERIAQSDPAEAIQMLELHSDQPGWRLGRRVRRRLAKLKAPR